MTTIRDLARNAQALQQEIDQLTRPPAATLRVLALDCATVTGWATNCAGGVESGFQTFELRRGSSPGMRFLEFRQWLTEMVQGYWPDVLVFEQAHHRGGAPTELGIGLATRVMEVAATFGLEYRAVHSCTLKKHATGRGNADKSEMIAAAQARYGLARDLDDNEADALLLLAFALDGFPEPETRTKSRRKTQAKA